MLYTYKNLVRTITTHIQKKENKRKKKKRTTTWNNIKILINCQSKGNSQERQKLTHIEYGDTKLKIASRELAVITTP